MSMLEEQWCSVYRSTAAGDGIDSWRASSRCSVRVVLVSGCRMEITWGEGDFPVPTERILDPRADEISKNPRGGKAATKRRRRNTQKTTNKAWTVGFGGLVWSGTGKCSRMRSKSKVMGGSDLGEHRWYFPKQASLGDAALTMARTSNFISSGEANHSMSKYPRITSLIGSYMVYAVFLYKI